MNSINEIQQQLLNISNYKGDNLIEYAFEVSCKIIGKDPQTGHIAKLTQHLTNHPIFQSLDNQPDYHNIKHAAQAMISAAILAKEEYSEQPEKMQYFGSTLILSMMVHDIGHPGRSNKHYRELEWASFNTFNDLAQDYRKKTIQEADSQNKKTTPENIWNGLINTVREVVLGTEFSKDAVINAKNYNEGVPSPNELKTLKILANEADVLASSLSMTGPNLGRKLAKEAGEPKLGSYQSRLGFLEHMVKPLLISKAAKNLKLLEHVNLQIESIDKIKTKELDSMDYKTADLTIINLVKEQEKLNQISEHTINNSKVLEKIEKFRLNNQSQNKIVKPT